jgi:hypothetical protein
MVARSPGHKAFDSAHDNGVSLARNGDYTRVRRMCWTLTGIGAGALVGSGALIASRPGLFAALPFTLGLSVLLGFVLLEVYPAIAPYPHHLSAGSGGLVIVRRYLLRDHYQQLSWPSILGIRPLEDLHRGGSRRLVVTFHPPARPKWTEAFLVSGEAGEVVSSRMPPNLRII